jgi:DNA-binding SARP family transcriptional activator
LLGSLDVTAADGRTVVVTRGHESSLLALLLLQRNAPISVDRIIDELWADAAPENARKSIHIYVSRLRKVIGSSEIETSAAGYRLVVPPDAVDVSAFEGLVEEGRSALNRGDPGLAHETFVRCGRGGRRTSRAAPRIERQLGRRRGLVGRRLRIVGVG